MKLTEENKTTYPILIGSYALNQKGLSETDIDLISDKKIINDKYKLDVVLTSESYSKKLIFDYCNKHEMEVITICDDLKVINCPIELLYCLKKSHIHRILPLTNNQEKNIDLWFRAVKQYEHLRNNCSISYKELDTILYENKNIYENKNYKYADVMPDVFYESFNEVNKRISDTVISMDTNKENFFKDNVERFFEHDLLHKYVAKMNRNSEVLLFELYQSDDKVSINKDKFLSDSKSNQINMIKEEIIVLFLERNMIPTIMNCYIKEKIKYVKYSQNKFDSEIKFIIANYATNLCDKGHSWLRNYVIDHLQFLMEYDLESIEDLACKITKCDELDDEYNKNKISLEEIMEYAKNKNNILLQNIESNTSINIDNFINKDNKLINIIKDKFNNYPKYTSIIDINSKLVMYNTYLNFGIVYSDQWEIFWFGTEEDDNKLIIIGEIYGLNLKCSSFEDTMKTKYKNYYFYSSGGCEYGEDSGIRSTTPSGRHKIISSYGTLPYSIEGFISQLCDEYFNIKKFDRNSHYSNNNDYESYYVLGSSTENSNSDDDKKTDSD